MQLQVHVSSPNESLQTPGNISSSSTSPAGALIDNTLKSSKHRRTSRTPSFFDFRAEGSTSGGSKAKTGEGSPGAHADKQKAEKENQPQEGPDDEPDALADLLARRLGQPPIPHACLILRLAVQTLGIGRLLQNSFTSCASCANEALRQWLVILGIIVLLFVALFTTKLLNGIVMLGMVAADTVL